MITLSFSCLFLHLLLVDAECRCSNLLSHHNREFKEDAPHCFVTEGCQFLNFMVYWISMICCCQVCCSAVSQLSRTGSTNCRVPWGPSKLTFVWLYVEYSVFWIAEGIFQTCSCSTFGFSTSDYWVVSYAGDCTWWSVFFFFSCLQIITLKLWKSVQPSDYTTAFLIFFLLHFCPYHHWPLSWTASLKAIFWHLAV